MFSSIVWRWDPVCDVNIPRVISVQQAVFEPFSGRKQVHYCIKNYIKMREEIGQQGQRLLTATKQAWIVG